MAEIVPQMSLEGELLVRLGDTAPVGIGTFWLSVPVEVGQGDDGQPTMRVPPHVMSEHLAAALRDAAVKIEEENTPDDDRD